MTAAKIAAVRLYRTADDVIVAEGDPRAAFHLVGPGKPIPDGYEVPDWAVAGKAEEPKAETPEVTEPADDTPAPEKPAVPVKKAAKKVGTKVVKKAANK